MLICASALLPAEQSLRAIYLDLVSRFAFRTKLTYVLSAMLLFRDYSMKILSILPQTA